MEDFQPIYEYDFKLDFGWDVKVVVDYPSNAQAIATDLKRLSNKTRRDFAESILENVDAEMYHTIKVRGCRNSFVRILGKLFQTDIQVYWMRCPTNTVVILSPKTDDSDSDLSE